MATWTLYLMQTPLNTTSGTGMITPLTLASGISMGYKVDDIDTLSFTVPGRHYQTALIKESLTDVIAYRDDEAVQRFRVVSMQLAGQGTNVTVTVTCSSYREVVNSWMFQDATDIGTGFMTASTETVEITPDPGLVVDDVVIFGNVAGAADRFSGSYNWIRTVVSPGVYEITWSPGWPGPDILVDSPIDHVYKPTDQLDYFTVNSRGYFETPTSTSGLTVWTFHNPFGGATAPHGLPVGQPVFVGANPAFGLYQDIYYVKTVPTSSTLTLAATLGGSAVAVINPSNLIGGQTFGILTDHDRADWVAWNIVNEGQSKTYGDIGVTQGVTPVNGLPYQQFFRDINNVNPNDQAHYFAPSQSRADGINQMAQLAEDQGFEWSIDIDPAAPWTGLKFNTWNRDGRFRAVAGMSNFVLSEASMASWTITRDMADYANVLRTTPNTDTIDGTVGGLDPPVWRPASFDPENSVQDPDATSRGRWEMSVPSTQYKPELVESFADEQLKVHQDRSVGVQCTLMPGRWQGLDDFWIGDSMRLLLQVPLVDDDNVPTGEYLVDLVDTVRAVGINITVGTNGSEDVSLELNRPSKTLVDTIHRLSGDTQTLKRR